MELVQKQSLRQTMSQTMIQSLAVLQMPIVELYPFISERVLENPVLDVEAPASMSVELPQYLTPRRLIWETDYSGERSERSPDDFPQEPFEAQDDFREMLHLQLGEERMLPPDMLPLCHFLVDSLNNRGYLEDPIELLAGIAGVPAADMTQAMYAVQELTPTGVGARTLQECLVLQLVQTPDFNASTLKLVTAGLDLLAANDLGGIAALLGVGRAEAESCCAAVRRLNPIPSRGYRTGSDSIFVIPEAEVSAEGRRWAVRYNERALPKLRIHPDYEAMLRRSDDPQLTEYLKTQMDRAHELMHMIYARESTLVRVIECIVQYQSEFLMRGFEALRPLSIGEVAEDLDLSPSTVGRAVQGKFILTPQGMLELKRLFSGPASADSAVSAAGARERLRALVKAEDRRDPLSDERLCSAMKALGVPISRRTVAKYRAELGIPPAAKRKQRE